MEYTRQYIETGITCKDVEALIYVIMYNTLNCTIICSFYVRLFKVVVSVIQNTEDIYWYRILDRKLGSKVFDNESNSKELNSGSFFFFSNNNSGFRYSNNRSKDSFGFGFQFYRISPALASTWTKPSQYGLLCK